MKFMACSEWRGRLNVASMRGFDTLAEAVAYLDETVDTSRWAGLPDMVLAERSCTRIYELFPDKKPKRHSYAELTKKPC